MSHLFTLIKYLEKNDYRLYISSSNIIINSNPVFSSKKDNNISIHLTINSKTIGCFNVVVKLVSGYETYKYTFIGYEDFLNQWDELFEENIAPESISLYIKPVSLLIYSRV